MDFKICRKYDRKLKMMNSLPCGIIWYDRDIMTSRKIIYINDKALEIVGFPDRETYDGDIEFDMYDFVDKETLRSFTKYADDLEITGVIQDVEFQINGVDGRNIICRGTLEIVETPSGESAIQSTILDITEEHTRESEMAALVRSIPGGMAIFQIKEEEIQTIYINDQIASIAGKDTVEVFRILKDDPLKVIHKNDVDRVRSEIYRVMRENDRLEEEFRIHIGTERMKWVRLTAKKVEQENRDVYFYAVIMDIDKSKQDAIQQKRQYDAELNRLRSIEKKAIATFCVDFSQNSIEYYHSKDNSLQIVTENRMSYTEYVHHIAAMISNRDEATRYLQLMDRQNLIERYYSGLNEVEIDYRRCTASNELVWENNEIRIMKRPDSEDIIGIGYIQDVNVEMNVYTVNRRLIDRLRTVMYEKLYFVIALHYDSQKYDIIRFTKKLSDTMSMEGNMQSLFLNIKKHCLSDADRDFMDIMLDESKLSKQIESCPNGEWIYVCKVPHTKQAKWFEFQIMKVKEKDENDHVYLVTASNVDKIKLQEQKLQEALEKAEKAGRAKQEFLSHMSHEIRTPLNGIKGALDIIMDSDIKLDASNKNLLEAAVISANHLTSLINDVLDMSKINEGKMQIYYSWIEMKDLLEQIQTIIMPMAMEKKIRYFCSVDLGRHQRIYSDMARLKQIFINMLSNAVKFTPNGGNIKLTGKVTSETEESIHVEFEIVDNGIGMTQEFLKRAMEPFEQEQRDMSQVGTGLGMSITKKLVTLLNGTFDIKSQVGIGTRIQIGFDFKIENDKVCGNKAKTNKNKYTGLDFKGIRALIVEDNDINMLIAKRLLESMNIETESAANGLQAVNMFEESEQGYYDIIFMDIMMPIKDGITATVEIREMNREDVKNIPIVAMTANAFVEDINKTLSSGMNYHLSKPFDKEQIQEVLVQEFAAERKSK